jgi:hydrogenase/urease accessory protein HupE
MKAGWWTSIVLGVALLAPALCHAHESRPAYLEITEIQSGQYELLWKIPRRGDLVLPLSVMLPEVCTDAVPGAKYALPGAAVERRLIDCGEAGLNGREIGVRGLSATITDVLVRIQTLDGQAQTVILKPHSPTFEVLKTQSNLAVLQAYITLGIGHILFGIDHLLFVLCLLLLVDRIGPLIKTITAFTAAHSITLGLAVLGFVHVPQPPVEAVIALSILFLATELVKARRGIPAITTQYAWVVALCFGLLHGFGFAGALSEIGLPQTAVPLALFSFNVGVEIGQLLFIAAASLVIWAIKKVDLSWPDWTDQLINYTVGTLAAFWCIQRIAAF